MANFVEDLQEKQAFAIASLKEAKNFNRFVSVEVIGIENLSLHGESMECLKVFFEGIYGYLPKSKIDNYDFYSIDTFVNSQLEVMVETVIEDEHKTIFLANREAALEVQANIFWKRGRKGDIVEAYISGVDKMNVYLIVNGVRTRMSKENFSYRYISDMREVVHRGETIRVQVIEFNAEEKQLAVSSRVLEADPKTFLNEYSVGGRYGAVINNIDPDRGVFVSLRPHGITALAVLPSLTVGKHLNVGDVVSVQVTRKDEVKGFIFGRLVVPKVGQYRKARFS